MTAPLKRLHHSEDCRLHHSYCNTSTAPLKRLQRLHHSDCTTQTATLKRLPHSKDCTTQTAPLRLNHSDCTTQKTASLKRLHHSDSTTLKTASLKRQHHTEDRIKLSLDTAVASYYTATIVHNEPSWLAWRTVTGWFMLFLLACSL